MTALQFLDSIVAPTISEAEQEPPSRRRVFLACVAAFHALDYFEQDKKACAALCKQTRLNCPDFKLVERVANAFKHKVSLYEPLRVESVVERPPFRCGNGQCGVSRLGDIAGGVEVWGEDSPDILPALKRVLMYLRGKASDCPGHPDVTRNGG